MSQLVEVDAISEVDEVFIQRCFLAQADQAMRLRSSTASMRIAGLKRLRHALLASREALYQAFQDDFRKPATEVELTEILPVLDEIRHAIQHLGRWMRPRRAAMTLMSLGNRGRVEFQPRGRCLIIGPWNYPVATVLGPIVSAIAAGNTVVCKPSEYTPSVNRVLNGIVMSAFERHTVVLVTGGVPTATALLKLPFDHIFFTGSPSVGRIVMAAASRHLTSVTLELGGKSPVVIGESADLKRAAELVLWGKFINAGQSCIAPDYLFVHNRVREEFVEHCRRLLQERYGTDGDDTADHPDLARMINRQQAQRVVGLLEEAMANGVPLLAGGQHDVGRCYIGPTLLGDPGTTSRIAQEEIFGPVLPVIGFDDITEVISRINSGPKPLALYLWSRRAAEIRQLLAQISSGGVCVNQCMQHYTHSNLPFGGVNHSGMGSSHGFFGFRAFSHERAVLTGGRFTPAQLLFPPYTASKHKLARMISALVR